MRSRATIHDDFVARFHFGERPLPVTVQQLDAVEAELDSTLPSAFREFMTRHGAVYTPSILDEISDNNIEHPDIQNILDPDKAVEGTKAYWSAGMPTDVIGVASDCMGNIIGFRRRAGFVEDAPVVFFDHDFDEVTELAPTFDEFLNWYVEHLKSSSQ
jgi:cell wall assembly regulator SMI1